MFHFETTTIWTSEFSQCVTEYECYLVEKKALLLIFSSLTIMKVMKGVFMRSYASFRVERKSFYRKSELKMFLLISGGNICVPKLYKNMASPYIWFCWLLPLDCFQFIIIIILCLVYCVTVKTNYWKFKILVTRPCVSYLIFAYFLKQNCCQIPLAEWTNEVWIPPHPDWLYIDLDHLQEKFGPTM